MSLTITVPLDNIQKLQELLTYFKIESPQPLPVPPQKEDDFVEICECGSHYKTIYKRKHIKTKKHIEYLNNKKE